MKLFEDKIRNNSQVGLLGDNIYEYFDSNSQPKIDKIRNLLNDWFANYPDEHKSDLINNFKNKFYDSFYELFIHELFHKIGYTLTPHPTLEHSQKKPDFLAIRGSEEFYIEATTISYVSDLEQKKENFRDKFIEELNKVDSPNFWIVLKDIKFKTDHFPKIKLLKKKIEKEIETLSLNDFQDYDTNLLNSFKMIEDNNVIINISFIKKSIDRKSVV